ncbi:cyclin-Q [Palaemon carinicauda]|uniref:cyclin-Q n=1 Tax=Palaemon carinicauda TaxID=392227 RepID=UPI0035B673BE
MEFQSDSKKTTPVEQEPEDLNPVIDYSECHNQFAGARYIIECGVKLKGNVLTVATAATYFHRFFHSISLDEYDPYLIGCTCLYLASKVEDDDIKIRDIINVGLNCVRRESPPLSLDPYFALRDSLIQAELLLMRVLGFKLKIDLPHKYLLHYLESLKEWLGEKKFDSIPFVDLSFTLLQEIYHSPIVIKYSPQLLSAAILNVVNQVYGVVVPGCDELNDQSWFTVLHSDCTTKAVWEVSTKILALYKEESTLKTK